MSITKTLENMQTALDNAYDSIEQMGGVAPQSRNMVNLAGTIDNLNNTVIAGVRGTNDAYDPDNKDYVVGESCIYNNVVYLAKVAITKPAGAFDPSKWNESSLKTLMEGVNANTNAISDISTLKSTSFTSQYLSRTADLYRIGSLVFLTYLGNFINIPAGSFQLGNVIPLGFRPVSNLDIGERHLGSITLFITSDGEINCYNYESATTDRNGQFTACWITTNPLPN